MKKIINGRKYDTDTARKVCEWEVDGHTAAVYRKETGEYFWWREPSWLGGAAICPMCEEIARGYCEKHMSVDDYEAEFGEVEE